MRSYGVPHGRAGHVRSDDYGTGSSACSRLSDIVFDWVLAFVTCLVTITIVYVLYTAAQQLRMS